AQLRRYAGSYTSTRASRGEPSAALTLFSSVSVEATADGLRTTDPLLGERHWAPVEPGVFRSAEGDRLAFIERDGEVVGLGLDLVPSQNYERAPWYDSPALHLAVALGALLVLATVAVWPVLALVRRLRGRPGTAPAAARAARWAAGGAAVLCVGFTVLTAVLLSDMHLAETLVLTGSPLLTVPLTVAAAAAGAALAGAVWAWPARWWGGAGRSHHTLVALAAAAVAAGGARCAPSLLALWPPAPGRSPSGARPGPADVGGAQRPHGRAVGVDQQVLGRRPGVHGVQQLLSGQVRREHRLGGERPRGVGDRQPRPPLRGHRV